MHYPIRSAAGKQKRADSKPKLNLPDWEDTLRNQKQNKREKLKGRAAMGHVPALRPLAEVASASRLV
jgi:hypothetical protein